MSKGFKVSVTILVAAMFILSACAPVATPAAAPTPEVVVETEAPVATEAPVVPEDPMAMYMPDAVSGAIVSAGSSTVFPLSERMKQRFEEEGFSGELTIDSIGSGSGFSRFCVDGDIDIANASRKIKDSELESCKAIGREPLEFRVGTDALSVVVSKANTFLTDVTKAELAAIFSTAVKWSDVRPDWPAEDILRFIPGTDSGTFDYFVEAIIAPANPGDDGKANVEKGEAAILASNNLQMSEDDNVLVQGVEGSPYAVGFFGFAYYQENADKLNVLSIDGIAPTAETAEDNSYPISRPLFIYTTAQIMMDKPQVASFVYFYLANVNNEINDVGYFPASDDVLAEALNVWKISVGLAEDPMAMYMPDAVSGAIVSAGSSTVFPLSERMKQRFEEEGFSGELTIDSIGSGSGFSRFCVDGDIDIANASRKIKDSELESCKAIGREPLEFRVGTDALSVVVSKANTFLTDVTKAELAAIFSTAVKWSDVRPDWPAEDILRFIPGTDSGTFDYFVEAIIAPANPGDDGKANVEKGEAAILASNNLQMSEDDNVLVQGVEGSPYAIGFFGFAYYQENADKLNVLSIDGIAPTAETAEDNSYPISRPLFIYTTAQIMMDKPQVASFVYFYLANVNNEINDVGYFPASDDVLAEALNNWKTAVLK